MSETVVKNLRDGELVIFDGTSPEESVLLACDNGDLRFEVRENFVQVMDRGDLSHVRRGDQAPVPVSFSVKFKEFLLQGSNPVTPWEALKQVGGAAAWTSTNSGGSDDYAVGLRFTVRSPVTAETDERITFAEFFPESVQFQGADANVLSVSGFSFETAPTIAKVAEGS